MCVMSLEFDKDVPVYRVKPPDGGCWTLFNVDKRYPVDPEPSCRATSGLMLLSLNDCDSKPWLMVRSSFSAGVYF